MGHRSAYRIFVGKPGRKISLHRPSLAWEDIIKWIIEK
jgi:hypothetical protein